MSDWADDKADELNRKWKACLLVCEIDDLAAAIRAARNEALEEVARVLAAEDERHAEIIVRGLKDK